MNRRLLSAAILLAVVVSPLFAEKHHNVVFEATVVRVEPWGLVAISCGVAIVYRLAEYKIDVVYQGHLKRGQQLIVRHLACNHNELDELQPGDKVILEAVKLSKPEKRDWMTYPKKLKLNEPMPSREVAVSYDAIKVAKLIYPTVNSTP